MQNVIINDDNNDCVNNKYANDTDNDDSILSKHCLSMRRAFEYCQNELKKFDGSKYFNALYSIDDNVMKSAFAKARSLPKQRQDALEKFWKEINKTSKVDSKKCVATERKRNDASTTASSFDDNYDETVANEHLLDGAIISTVDLSNDFSDNLVQDWISTFQHGNQPCVVKGLHENYFNVVNQEWKLSQSNVDSKCSNDNSNDNYNGDSNEAIVESLVNYSWFEKTLGMDCIVPVRCQSTTTTTTTINPGDEDRATECETKNMTLREWLDYLRQCRSDDNNKRNKAGRDDLANYYYLKDWHLVSLLEQKLTSSLQDNGVLLPLYQVPSIFSFDLLNSFLRRFTDGDYMFCYFGPANSFTDLHSDVLNSFSWSYNVVGTKLWTFYPPYSTSSITKTTIATTNHNSNNTIINESSCQATKETKSTSTAGQTTPKHTIMHLIQHAGECVFVPATWKHKVRNLVETISINHNWITTANLDLTWECIQQDIVAVEKELQGFDIVVDWEARENMLRGSCGLDVTAFYFMIVTRLIDVLLLIEKNKHASWQDCFDVIRLTDMLQKLNKDTTVCLKERLSASLASPSLGTQAHKAGQRLLSQSAFLIQKYVE